MSDPARDGYQCHGPLVEIHLLDGHDGPSAFLCKECYVYRHALPVGDGRRAQIDIAMRAIIEAMRDDEAKPC